MEIILNDLSLDGQFQDFEEFERYFIETLNAVLTVIAEKNITLYKMTMLLEREVIKGITLIQLLHQKTNVAALAVLRKRFIQLMDNPFLDDDIKADADGVYCYPAVAEEPNCFTEAIERVAPMLSFPNEQFEQDYFACEKSKMTITLHNIKDLKGLLDELLLRNREEIGYILEKYPFSKKILLAGTEGRYHTVQAIVENGLLLEDIQKILRQLPMLIEDKQNGRKTHRWENIDGPINEYRVTISEDREFRIMFLWQDGLILMNGFVKKRQTTPKGEIDKAKMIARQYI